jgi:hypothetical protein
MRLDYSPHILLRSNTIELSCMGSPKIVYSDSVSPQPYESTSFNGEEDGLFLHYNPLGSTRCFSVSIMIKPSHDGPFEQRFFHIQDVGSDDRFLMEIRMLKNGKWYADSYFEFQGRSVMLQEPHLLHESCKWHNIKVSYDGTMFTHMIDDTIEASKLFPEAKLPEVGITSIGMRVNRVYPFKGKIGSIQFQKQDTQNAQP